MSSSILYREQITQAVIEVTRRCDPTKVQGMWVSPILEIIRLIATCELPRE
jgi:hypothetical protein